MLCSCNDDLFVKRESADFFICDDEIPASGGQATIYFKGAKEQLPAVYVYYIDDNGDEIFIVQRVVSGVADFSMSFVKFTAEYDIHSGKLVLALTRNLIAKDLHVRVSRKFDIDGEEVDQTAEILLRAASPMRLGEFNYDDEYETRTQSSKTTYNYINTADTTTVFTLPKCLRWPSGYFRFDLSLAPFLFGDSIPSVPSATIRDGNVVTLDAEVQLSEKGFSLPVEAAEIDEVDRSYVVPPRSLLEVKVTFVEARYRVHFSACAAGDAEYLVTGAYYLTVPSVESISHGAYSLDSGEEVTP